MKKLITLFLAGMMLFTLCACEKYETYDEKAARLERQLKDAEELYAEQNWEYQQLKKAIWDLEQAEKALENAK